MEGNYKRIICPSCNNIFTNPRTLMCGHTFCMMCVSSSKEFDGLMDICALCNVLTSTEDVYCAPYVRHLMEVFTKLKSADGANCSFCTHNATADYLCTDCDDFYCRRCINIHNKIPSTCKHKSCLLREFLADDQFAVKEKEVIICSSHSLPIDLYCITCEQSVCRNCSDHDEHNIQNLNKTYRDLVSNALKLKELADTNVRKLETALSDIETIEYNLEKYREICNDNLADREFQLLSCVKERMRGIQAQLQDKYACKQSLADVQVAKLSKSQRNIEYSLKTMDHLETVENTPLVMSTCLKILRSLELENDRLKSVEPVINPHMGITLDSDDTIGRIQMTPDIVLLNNSIAKNCKLQVFDDVVIGGHTSKLSLTTYDLDGNAVTVGGADVRAVFRHHTGDHEVEANITDNDDGSYDITGSCDVTGKYSIHTFVFDRLIRDQHEITVVRWVPLKKDIVVSKGEHINVTLQAVDDFENIVENSPELIYADLVSPSGFVSHVDIENHNGVCDIKHRFTEENEPGHWKILFVDKNERKTVVNIYVLEWSFDVSTLFKQLQQCIELNVIVSQTSPSRDPENEPIMRLTLTNPDGEKYTLPAIKTDETTYSLHLKCDRLGKWRLEASVFDCPLQPVDINMIEWVTDALSLLTIGEEFKFRVWGRDVNGSPVQGATANVASQATSGSGEVVELPVEVTDDDKYFISGRFDDFGKVCLSITVDDVLIAPIEINVLKWKLDVSGPIMLTRGESFQAPLVAFDSTGNVVTEVKGPTKAILTKNTDRHSVDVIENINGSLSVKGKCMEIGLWKLDILLSDILITSSDVHVIDWTVNKRNIKMSVGQTFNVLISAIDESQVKRIVDKYDVSGELRNTKGRFRRSKTVKVNDSSFQLFGQCNVNGLWVLNIAVNGYLVPDLAVLIDVVKEEAVVGIETRSFWRNNKNPRTPTDLATYSHGRILICNGTNEILQLSNTGVFLSRIYLKNKERQINCICSTNDDKLVLLDKNKREILVLPGFCQSISAVFGSNELRSPSSLTVDKNADNIFVVDNSKRCVMKFNISGDLIKVVRPDGGKLKQPTFVTINNDGNILIADAGINCIQMFNPDGDFIKIWKEPNKEDGFMVMPQRVLVYQDGTGIITCDHRLDLLDKDGHHIRKIHEDAITRLVNPFAVALTSEMPRQVAFFRLGSSELLLKYN